MMGARKKVKDQFCPAGLFFGLSLEQQRSVMNSNPGGDRELAVYDV